MHTYCPMSIQLFFFWLSHFVMLVETGLLLVLILWCIFRNRQHRSNYMKIIRQSRSVTCTCTRINVSVSVNYIPRIIYTQIWWKDQMLEHSSVWLPVTMMATWMSMLKVDLSLACMQSEMLTRIDWLQIKMYISFTNEWPVHLLHERILRVTFLLFFVTRDNEANITCTIIEEVRSTDSMMW